MTTQEIFAGITTTELMSYKINGDNSKELSQEIQRRISIEAKSRKNKVNNTELDAKYNGYKTKWIGYSKGVAYPLLRLGKSENTGWCIIDGWSTPVCCLFEKILVNGKIQNINNK